MPSSFHNTMGQSRSLTRHSGVVQWGSSILVFKHVPAETAIGSARAEPPNANHDHVMHVNKTVESLRRKTCNTYRHKRVIPMPLRSLLRFTKNLYCFFFNFIVITVHYRTAKISVWALTSRQCSSRHLEHGHRVSVSEFCKISFTAK